MIALIDCGNTRIKWALATSDGIVDRGGAEHRETPDAAIAAVAAAAGDADTVFVASVMGDIFTDRLLVALGRPDRPAHRVATRAEAFGLSIAYHDPAALGVDRWLAMLGARARHDGVVCVVSAGTAVTFDAVDATGRHLGGFIWPGPRMAAEALETRTDRIGATPPPAAARAGLDILGRSTAEAVGHGSLFAIAAAIDRAVRIVAAGTGAETAVLLTGGDAGVLMAWLESPASIEPDLVLEGLRLVAASTG